MLDAHSKSRGIKYVSTMGVGTLARDGLLNTLLTCFYSVS